MAINSCTINSFTLNSARCRRAIIIPPEPPVTSLGTNNAHVSVAFAKQHPHLVRHAEYEIEDQPQLKFEQPFITVTAELMGEVGTHTLESSTQLEFVSVINLHISEYTSDDTVNILDTSI